MPDSFGARCGCSRSRWRRASRRSRPWPGKTLRRQTRGRDAPSFPTPTGRNPRRRPCYSAPAAAARPVADDRSAVAGAAQAALRDTLGRTLLADVLSDRQRLDAEMTETLDAQTEAWGVKVASVLIRDIRIPDALQDAMSRVAQAE